MENIFVVLSKTSRARNYKVDTSNRRRAGEHGNLFFQSKVFREESVARRARPDPLDERLQVMAPHEWMALAGLGLSLLAFLAWGAFGRCNATSRPRRCCCRSIGVRRTARGSVLPVPMKTNRIFPQMATATYRTTGVAMP